MTKSFDVHFIRGALIHATLPKIGPSTTENVQVMFKKTLSLIPENRSLYESMQEGYTSHLEIPIKDLKQQDKMSIYKSEIKLFKYSMFSVFKVRDRSYIIMEINKVKISPLKILSKNYRTQKRGTF